MKILILIYFNEKNLVMSKTFRTFALELEKLYKLQDETMYNVYDTTGHIVRGYFKSWTDAHNFICMNNRFDWSIKYA